MNKNSKLKTALIRPQVYGLKPYTPGRSAEEVAHAYGLKDVIKLASNENPLGPSPRALDAMQSALKKSAVYPDGGARPLHQALAEKFGVDVSQVLAGNGSDEILLMAAAAVLREGEDVVVSPPTFSQYERAGLLFGGGVKTVPLKNFQYDVEAMLAAVTDKTRMLFLCNPNNPTGHYCGATSLEKLLKEMPKNVLVVLDEAYAEFAEAGDFPSGADYLKDYPNLLVCRTFSKLYGLAGLRVGYGLSSSEVMDALRRVKNLIPFNVNHVAQAAAVAALADTEFVDKTLALVRDGRAWLEEAFEQRKIRVLPSQANFLCFEISGPGGQPAASDEPGVAHRGDSYKTGVAGSGGKSPDSPGFAHPPDSIGELSSGSPAVDKPADALAETFARRGLVIRSLSSFGMDRWCRVTVGTPEQNQKFISLWDEIHQRD